VAYLPDNPVQPGGTGSVGGNVEGAVSFLTDFLGSHLGGLFGGSNDSPQQKDALKKLSDYDRANPQTKAQRKADPVRLEIYRAAQEGRAPNLPGRSAPTIEPASGAAGSDYPVLGTKGFGTAAVVAGSLASIKAARSNRDAIERAAKIARAFGVAKRVGKKVPRLRGVGRVGGVGGFIATTVGERLIKGIAGWATEKNEREYLRRTQAEDRAINVRFHQVRRQRTLVPALSGGSARAAVPSPAALSSSGGATIRKSRSAGAIRPPSVKLGPTPPSAIGVTVPLPQPTPVITRGTTTSKSPTTGANKSWEQKVRELLRQKVGGNLKSRRDALIDRGISRLLDKPTKPRNSTSVFPPSTGNAATLLPSSGSSAMNSLEWQSGLKPSAAPQAGQLRCYSVKPKNRGKKKARRKSKPCAC